MAAVPARRDSEATLLAFAQGFTSHPVALDWLMKVCRAHPDDSATHTLAGRLLQATEADPSAAEHPLVELIKSSRPYGDSQARSAEWRDTWARTARSSIYGVRHEAAGDGPIDAESSTAIDRLIAVGVFDLASEEATRLYRERDGLFPLRDMDDPAGRVYGPLATPEGTLREDASMSGMSFFQGGRKYLVNTLAGTGKPSKKAEASGNAIADALRDDTSAVLETMRYDPPRAGGSPSEPRCHARLIEAVELPPHQAALAGGLGLYMNYVQPGTPAWEKRGTIENRMIATVVVARTDVLAKGQKLQVPTGEDKSRCLLAPRRGGGEFLFCTTVFGNSSASMNVALKANPRTPDRPMALLDLESTNAMLLPFWNRPFEATDPDETMSVMAIGVYDKIFEQPPTRHNDVQIFGDLGDEFIRDSLMPELRPAPIDARRRAPG